MAAKQGLELLPQRGPGPAGRRFAERPKLRNTKETIIRIWGYLSARKILLSVAFFFIVANAVLTLIAAYMVRPIINGIIDGSGLTTLVKNLIIMASIYACAGVSNYMQSRLMLEVAQSALEKMRYDLLVALQKLPLKYFDSHNNGDLMSRFTNDVDVINQMLSTTCVQFISGIITLITITCIMFYTNWILTIVTLCLSPMFTLATKQIGKRSMKAYKAQQGSIGELNGYIEELVTGQKVIKVFNHEEEAAKGFSSLNQDYRKKSFNAQFLSSMMGPIMSSIGQLSYSVTAGVAGMMCLLQGFDVGGYTVFVNYARSFTRPINDMAGQVNTIFAALAGAERVFDVMDADPEFADADDAVEIENMIGNVEFKDVVFGYVEGQTILKGISLSANSGEKIAFVGSTGAGKTTIINLVNRFYEINSGEITIDGVDIRHIKKDFLRENIAVVLQDTHLFSGTVMENIRYGRLDASDEEVIEAAKTANADGFIRRLEHGYDTMLDGDGSNLSQGQRQLLNIARTAISKAPILVLDEATSSVDTRTERYIEQALDRLTSQRTTFVIAHRLSTVRNSDRIMVLEKGEIIEQGNHHELLEKKGRYFDLYTGLSLLE
ncbi:MAG: ABC transporter ATP-binding protein [Bacillota bacterium]